MLKNFVRRSKLIQRSLGKNVNRRLCSSRNEKTTHFGYQNVKLDEKQNLVYVNRRSRENRLFKKEIAL